MPLEIERKFLVKNDDWRKFVSNGTEYVQGYIFDNDKKVLRVRTTGDKAYITIKAAIEGNSLVRHEYEYSIPLNEAKEMLENFCFEGKIEKIRYIFNYHGNKWEIDEFKGGNKGLVLAEIELDDPNTKIDTPDWIGEEVTDDPRYLNNSLSKNPYPFK